MLGLRPISKINSARAVHAHFPAARSISHLRACTHREITPIFYTIPLYKSMGDEEFYGALTVSVRTPRLSEMTRMANSEGLNGESVETAAYANAPRRSV